ncbi:hypothetical protein NM688_g4752 [Phlebia brevispora]|uniref:Uncharacterized protein n=1 Tax=Phlebia brevispora TaxID=194682 RepID=A0ACC1T2B2_9APHY|nr:hypothetical protein NM688_g4752 [Phlebia brevispora]
MNNERFEKYYKGQKILPDDEWETFLGSLKQPLPTTFRVAGSRQTAHLLNDTIKNTHVPHLAGVVFEGETVTPPSQIPWYPDGLAWQFNVAKKVLRKSPEFKKFHNFLVFETEVGNISRQEAVSMLPPLFLEVEPHHRVIDMCAAPGSKTAQLLEALHAHDTITSSSFPSGLLIANDSDYKRTHLLIHQSARLPSPALMVTNHDASIFPAIKIPSEHLVFAPGTKTRVVNKRQHQLLFDRILCDVPCSGDGTLRKNLAIWKKWSPMDGNGLHGLQLRILQRAMRMLQKGGRIVYSTCSMNPVENEAVVAAALKSIPGFELVDMSGHLPGLIYRPGMTTWTPAVNREVATNFATFQDFLQSVPESQRADVKMVESHWPPSPAEAEELHLARCMRIYPHLQDTGGFFIAALQKKLIPGESAPVAKESAENKRQAQHVEDLETSDPKKPRLSDNEHVPDSTADEVGDEHTDNDPVALPSTSQQPAQSTSQPTTGKASAGKGPDVHFKENPYTFLQSDDPVVKACFAQLNLTQDFPSSNMLIRNPTGEAVRSIYLTNDIVKDIALHNDYTRMRLMTCGTKVIGKQEGAAAKREGAEMQFRILSEGMPVMLPYIAPESIISADLAALKAMMQTYYPVCANFEEPFRSVVESKAPGCYIVRFQQGQMEGASLTHDLVLPIWKSNVSITLMLEKKAKSALSLRVFGEDVTTAAREAAQKKKEEASAQDAPVDAAEHDVENQNENVEEEWHLAKVLGRVYTRDLREIWYEICADARFRSVTPKRRLELATECSRLPEPNVNFSCAAVFAVGEWSLVLGLSSNHPIKLEYDLHETSRFYIALVLIAYRVPSSSKRKDPPESSSNAARPYSKTAAKEDRRKRGEIACAECRRLKYHVQRALVEGARHYAQTEYYRLGTTVGKFVSKSKEHLERKLAKMEERMRNLEDALAIAQAAETNERHPLLAVPWRIDDDEDERQPSEQDDKESLDSHALVESFGTLHVDERHRTVRFFGPAGEAEAKLASKRSQQGAAPNEADEPLSTDFRALGLPQELDVFYHAFPLAPPIGVPRTHVRATIESYLPSPERADELCRTFLEHMSWMFQIATYQQLTQDLMPPFYGRADSSDTAIYEDGPHDLALLLIVFAIGALVDLSLPAYNAEAQRYHILARAALALQPLMEKASLNTVKTLHLLSIFNGMSGKESNMANTYTVLNLAGHRTPYVFVAKFYCCVTELCEADIDPSHWKMSDKEMYARRIYFWNLLQGDLVQCMGTGRPPALADVRHNVKIPTEEEERAYQEKEIAVIGFGRWAFRYDQECMLPVIRIVTAAKPPSYQAILELDKKITSFHSHDEDDPPDSPDIAISMRRWVRSHYVDIMLLSLHRAFFAQAIAINPVNPLDTPYRHSFLTAYRSACHVIQTTSEQFMRYPQLLARVWMIWSLNFMSAMIIGVVASQTRDVALNPHPLAEFERACELFQDASGTNTRAAAALLARTSYPSTPTSTSAGETIKPER